MPRLYQINEEDLSELERILPELAEISSHQFTPAMRVKVRRVQGVLSRVRWNYGPHDCLERIDVGDSAD